MFALNALNVAIGMIFTWTILSMAAMTIQEWIASRRNWRAIMLENAIGNMLTDPAILQQFYNHPLIQSLYGGKEGDKKPSYIPSAEFAQVMMDILSTSGSEASLLQQQLYKLKGEILSKCGLKKAKAQKQLGLILALLRRMLVEKSGSESGRETLETVNKALEEFGNEFSGARPVINRAVGTVQSLKEEIKRHLAKLYKDQALLSESTPQKIISGVSALSITHPRLKQTMDALLIGVTEMSLESEMGLGQIRNNLEVWYNDSMDRLTGSYKRRTQITIFLIGLLMALLLNVDSLLLANRLWQEPYRGNSLVTSAESITEENTDEELASNIQEGISSLKTLLSNINLPIGWLSARADTGSREGTASASTCYIFPANSFNEYGVQIGNQCYQVVNAPLPSDMTGWLLKALGLLLTGVAVSQGAPFWFDVLKKITNVRLAGLNPSEGTTTYG